MPPFVPGWSPEVAARGRDRFHASGGSFFRGARFADDNRPLPDGFSLSGLLKWTYDQGPVGSCFANMMAHIQQLMMLAALASGHEGKVFNPSRRLIWYRCRQLDGSLGSWSDGGSIVNSFASVGPAPHGLGDCTEEEWPYRADHAWLEQTPPPSVVKDADPNRVLAIAELDFGDGTSTRRSIYNGSPVGIGIDWCSEWDMGYIDGAGRTTGIGRAVGGHAVAIVGWLRGWDGHDYYEILNSHGKIYPALPADVAARVPGYRPTGFTFWARADMLARLLGGRWAEAYTASGVSGFTRHVITLAEGLAL